jgi:Protein of unknown function (DUF4232)
VASHAQTVPLVAWSGAVPVGLRPAHGAPAPPCRARHLQVLEKGFIFQAAVAGATASLQLRNAGPAACRMTGRPAVRFVGAPRAPPQREIALPSPPRQFPQILRPAASLRALEPGSEAAVSITWANWCVPGARRAKGPLVPPRAVRVTLPSGGGSLDVPYSAVTSCIRPGAPSTIGVRPFQPTGLPNGRPWTTEPLGAKVLTLAGSAGPLHALRGAVLRYSVLLSNESRSTVGFTRCPLVAQMLAPNGAVEAHQLNCAGSSPVRPGGAIRFEMRLHVPTDAPLGANGLFWEIDPLGAQGPEVVSRVIVGDH